jgi:hypothetical protein
MLNSSNITRALVVTTLAAMLMTTGLARADASGTEDYPIVAASVPADGDRALQPLSCQELREIAWFYHELARTDGEVSPETPKVACGAESTTGAD